MQSLFKYHQLNPAGVAKVEAVAAAFDDLLSKIEAQCNVHSREFSITKTKLEEACFFAKKSIAIEWANQLNPE